MRSPGQQAASLRHLERARAANLSRRISIKCDGCRTGITLAPSIIKRGRRFCSRKCRYAVMRGSKSPNAGGGSWMLGSSNPNWKDGTGYERIKNHRGAKVRTWRRLVFERDAYTCQECGLSPKSNNQLNAHHIESWAAHPEKRFLISNGITLCKPCHKAVHARRN